MCFALFYSSYKLLYQKKRERETILQSLKVPLQCDYFIIHIQNQW